MEMARRNSGWILRVGGNACGVLVCAIVWLVVGTTGCGRAGGQPPAARIPGQSSEQRAPIPAATIAADRERVEIDPAIASLERLRKTGQFGQFVAATRQAADADPTNAAVGCLLIEAQLAVGENAAAAETALDAAQLALDSQQETLALRALRLWIVARMRLGKSLGDDTAMTSLDRMFDHDEMTTVHYWMTAFHNRQPYAPGNDDSSQLVELTPTKAADGTIWADLNAVEVRTNGVVQPMVFIDTGAQQTIMTLRAAETAGVVLGDGATELVGFAGLEAKPAVLDTLDLGGLTLHNVPVLVGNAPALMSAKGQMAIGTELMHHVRFTLDYPARKVLAQRAGAPRETSNALRFEVPLWTFSQACLVEAATDRGPARAMIDTGNRTGTYLSARWARQHLPQFERPTSTLVFKFRHQGLTLTKMELGGAVLADWPVGDRIPRNLEQLDLVDVLVGRDLLWPYRLSIDLDQRVMRIEGGPESPLPPPNPMP